MNQRVLIVEDDVRLAEMLGMHLGKLGCQVDYAEDGVQGVDMALGSQYSLIVLDRTLPGLEGLEVCRQIRAQNESVQVLMLTALADELDLIVGLETGADDYVSKPFKVGELMARVQALLRRASSETFSEKSRDSRIERRYGSLQLNVEKRNVIVRGENVELTPREFDLLVFLSSSPGRVFTREDILQEVWGSDVLGYDHSISTIVKRLRKKIEQNTSKPQHIQTVRGVGYRFAEE